MTASKSYENPLLGHVRMRAMFRALVEMRALSEQAGKRGIPKKLEACWVGTAIDLLAGDVSSGLHAGGYASLIRAVGARKTDRAATRTEFRRAAAQAAAAKPFPGAAIDGVCCAVGQAMALAAAEGKHLVVAYAGVDELTAAEWKRVFAVAQEGMLPLVVVAVPPVRTTAAIDLAGVAGAKIPVIPVDAGDAVALYRVMQETCVRARADGGVAVIECVRFGTDPVRLLGAQLSQKGVCTKSWIRKVEEGAQALQQWL